MASVGSGKTTSSYCQEWTTGGREIAGAAGRTGAAVAGAGVDGAAAEVLAPASVMLVSAGASSPDGAGAAAVAGVVAAAGALAGSGSVSSVVSFVASSEKNETQLPRTRPEAEGAEANAEQRKHRNGIIYLGTYSLNRCNCYTLYTVHQPHSPYIVIRSLHCTFYEATTTRTRTGALYGRSL